MTTYVEARDALVGRLDTAWATAYSAIPVFYENTTAIPLDTVGEVFLRAEIVFEGAMQKTIESVPVDRTWGRLFLTLMVKSGAGTRTTLAYLDFLKTTFKHARFGGVQAETPKPGRSLTKDGWHSQEFIVPFWFDSN